MEGKGEQDSIPLTYVFILHMEKNTQHNYNNNNHHSHKFQHICKGENDTNAGAKLELSLS